MKQKRILTLTLAIILCLAITAVFAGCSDNSAKESGGDSSGSEALLTVNGAEIKSVELRMVGETPNLSVVFANNTDKDVTLQAGEFSVKTADGKSYSLFESDTVLEAGNPYIQHAYTAFKDDLNVKEGDTVEIYYGDTLLDKGAVTTFG